MGDNNRDRDAKGRHARGAAITANRNTARGARHGSRTHPGLHRGSTNGNAKLTNAAVRRIVKLGATGRSKVEIARLTGVSDGTVCHILQGRTWRHITGIAARIKGQRG